MKKVFFLAGCWLLINSSFAQTVPQKLQNAFQQFERDSQLKHAISSLYVIDAKTGQVVFDENSQVGLAPASTQKIITSVTAFELLGKEFRYKTELGYRGQLKDNTINGDIFIIGNGDPTFGSWRWQNTGMQIVLNQFANSVKQMGVKSILGGFVYQDGKWESKEIPDGWIWQDIGNYYGANALSLNWNENQYDLFLKSDNKIGDSVKVVGTKPDMPFFKIVSELKSAAKGTGDNAYIYLPLGWESQFKVRGTIPVEEKQFKISGAMLYPQVTFLSSLSKKLDTVGINSYNGKFTSRSYEPIKEVVRDSITHTVLTYYSPSLDSIIYWFNKKSINLYGEALIKTFAYEKQGFGSTDSGVAIVKKFWKDKGLDDEELNIYDGSGLSPLNRVTTHAQVEILRYAKTKDWFPYFLRSLPDYNGMTMKSGTISDVKGFCGYHKAKDGKEYIFSFLVNNYSGKTSGLVSKMYKVLDELK